MQWFVTVGFRALCEYFYASNALLCCFEAHRLFNKPFLLWFVLSIDPYEIIGIHFFTIKYCLS